MTLRLGVLGLGSVFWGPYANLIQRLTHEGRVALVAGYDPDPDKRKATTDRFGIDTDFESPSDVINRDDVDVVLILTSMNEHGPLAREAMTAGKHVLVEKPMATSLEQAAELVTLSHELSPTLVCAPHIVLSQTYREMHRRVGDGAIGDVYLARARYGWSGPWWGRWFYEGGGGALFDLGVYNLTALCGFMGSVKRVTAMVGVAIPERVVEGEPMQVRADDNAHVLLDFGNSRFASIATGFTMQKYRSPAIELYGGDGVLQMLGDDWAPEGYELWRNDKAAWEVYPESDPTWPWTDGLRHLIECLENGVEPVTRPEHAYHALEIMLAAQAAGADGRAREISSDFPAPDLARLGEVGGHHRVHDPRSAS